MAKKKKLKDYEVKPSLTITRMGRPTKVVKWKPPKTPNKIEDTSGFEMIQVKDSWTPEFEMAFADSRSRGEETFNFNGKDYHTRQKDESDEDWKGVLRKNKIRKIMKKSKSYPL